MVNCKAPNLSKARLFKKFTCPGCSCSYIGKTDRCLQTRIKEHCQFDDSEIYKHINSRDEFNLNSNLLLSLPFNEPSLLIETVMENNVIIDKSKHWSILLLKEAFHIHRQKPILNHGTKASKELIIFN